jgi:hypothetical protein
MPPISTSNPFRKLYGDWEPLTKNWLEKIKPSELLKKKSLDYEHYKQSLIDLYSLAHFNPSFLDHKTSSSFWDLRTITPLAAFLIQERLKSNQSVLQNLKLPSLFWKPPLSNLEVQGVGSLAHFHTKTEGTKPNLQLPEAHFQFDPQKIRQLISSKIPVLEYEKDTNNFIQRISKLWKATESEKAETNYFEIKGYIDNKFSVAITNGIDTLKEKALELGQFVHAGLEGVNVHVLYNATTGIAGDVLEWGLNVSEKFLTPAIALHIQFIRHHFEHYPDKELLFITHSCGGAVLKSALNEIPPELREKIVIMNIGGGAYIPKTLCKNAKNYISTRDFVSFLSNLVARRFLVPANNFSNLLDCKFVLLKPEPGSKIVDHGIFEPTYQKKLKELMSSYLQRHRN